MAMVLKAKSETVASVVSDGIHQAVLSNVTSFDNAYGQRVGFEFTVVGGSADGAKLMRSTSPVLSEKSKLAEVLTGLLGRDLTSVELESGIDVEQLVGVQKSVLVLKTKSKGGAVYSNVERIF